MQTPKEMVIHKCLAMNTQSKHLAPQINNKESVTSSRVEVTSAASRPIKVYVCDKTQKQF